MSSYTKPIFRWAIRRRDTRELLGLTRNFSGDRLMKTAEFGAIVPMTFNDERSARETFISWLYDQRFIQRKPYKPGGQRGKIDVLKEIPPVDFVMVEFVIRAQSAFILEQPDAQ